MKIKLLQVNTETMPYPFSNCVEFHSQLDNVYSKEMKKLGMKYIRKNCLALCQQKLIIDMFGCYSLEFPKILDAKPCVNLTTYSFDNLDECFESCPYECKSRRYDVSVSYSDFPTVNYVDRLIQNDPQFYEHLYNTNEINYDMVKKSFVRLFIFYDEIKATFISESAKITFVDLIANIGGTLGLFIGISVLSLVEILELLISLIFIIVNFMLKHFRCNQI